MKKLFAIVACAFFVNAADAQTYSQVNVGAHTAKQMLSDKTYEHFGFGPGFSAGLSAGIIKNRWQASIGVSYLTHSASKELELRFEDQIDPLTGVITRGGEEKTKLSEKYSHIFVPIKVGYKIIQYKNWSLAPFLGVAGSYNFSQKSKTKSNNFGDGKWHETGNIGNPLVKASIWGGAGAEFAYKLNKHFGFNASPEAWYMINSFSGDSPVKQHTLTLGLNVGVRYSL